MNVIRMITCMKELHSMLNCCYMERYEDSAEMLQQILKIELNEEDEERNEV